MDWSWLIPVIAVVIWIIGNVARGAQEQKRAAAGQGQRPVPRPRATAKSDIERFLEEINQRRQQQQQHQQKRPAAQEAVVRPVAERRTSKPTAPRPAPQRPRPAPGNRPSRPLAEPILLRPAEPPPLALPVDEHLRVSERPPMQAPPPPVTVDAPAPVTGAIVRRTEILHLIELRNLLHSNHGVRTAFMLTEVLGTPRCKRPHRR